MMVRPMRSASDSRERLKGRVTPKFEVSPKAWVASSRVFAGWEAIASESVAAPSSISIAWLMRSLPWRAMACAISCPITVAMPLSSLVYSKIPL